MSRWESWDESRVRVRPNKKGSRPRTKETPDYSEAEIGLVVQVDRGRYTCVVSAGSSSPQQVSAVRAKALRRMPVVPGDRVRLVGDTSGEEGTLARLVEIETRRTVLRRSADDTDDAERVIVANADVLLIVVAAVNPQPRTGFIDRALVAAFEAGITPVLLITKADLVSDPTDPAGLVSHYRELDVTVVISSRTSTDDDGEVSSTALTVLRDLLRERVTAMVGHSGVGKSTMVNALTGRDRATGGVNEVTGRGRHTSSSAVALPLQEAASLSAAEAGRSWVIDTPGVRTFGLAHVGPDDVLASFGDLVEGSADCEPGCRHESAEGGCALDSFVASGAAGSHGPARLASLRNLLQSLSGHEASAEEKTLGQP